MSTPDQDRLREDYHINTNYTQPDQQPQLLPKVRSTVGSSSSSMSQRKPPVSSAVPATPRMLRNSSGNFLPQIGSGGGGNSTPSSSSHQQQGQRYLANDGLSSPQRSHFDAHHQIQGQSPAPSYRSTQGQSPLVNRTSSVRSPTKLPPLDTQERSISPQNQSSTPSKLLPPASVDQSQKSQAPPDNSTPSRSVSQSKKPAQPQQFHRRSIGDWDFVKTIGAGSMGKVKLAKHRGTNEVCAIKIVPRAARLYARAHANDPPPSTSQEALSRKKEYEKEVARDRRTIREASLGRILYHPYICRLFEVKVMSNHYYMLFEYVSGGQMLDYIVSHGSLKERHARKFARGIGSSLDYLHKNNVVHRDLKIENIMISKSGDIKIIDFGLSNLYSYEALLKTYCGSLYFAAPELLSAHPYIGPEVDVWSFGVVLYVLVCGKVPFDDQSVSVLHEKIKTGKVEYPDFLSPEVTSLLSRMLVVNPNKRAHLSEVLAHPWMTKGYEGPAQSYVPNRVPLSLPLDPNVIQEIVRLEFGQSEEHVLDELTHLVSSRLYQDATRKYEELAKSSAPHHELQVDPRTAFHPLVSIYYLVDEMLKRKRTRESILDIPPAASEALVVKGPADSQSSQQNIPSSTQNQEQQLPQQQQQLPLNQITTPTPPPQLTFPEAAHTSPIHSASPMPMPDQNHPQIMISDVSGNNEVIQQQGKKNEESKGLNSLLRKFSQRRSHSTRRPTGQGYTHAGSGEDAAIQAKLTMEQAALVRRVGSMKLRKTPFGDDDEDKASVKSSKSHHRTVSAYAGPTTSNTADEHIPPLPTNLGVTSTQRKFHPTARAKSVGHRRDANAYDAGSSSNAPPVPADSNEDAFFDDITLDDYSAHSGNDKLTLVNTDNSAALQARSHLGTELTEQQILDQAAAAPAGTMPSIEFPRSMFLKGFFSVQTTSTKPLPVIRADVISVLSKFGVQFTEVRGGFICTHTPSIVPTSPSNAPSIDEKATAGEFDMASTTKSNKSSSENSTENAKLDKSMQQTDNSSLGESWNTDHLSTPGSKTHRRKFSLGGTILGYKRKPSMGGFPAIPATPVASTGYGNNMLNSPNAQHHSAHGDFDSSASLDSLNHGHGGSDMLVSSRIEQSRPRTHSTNVDHGDGEGVAGAGANTVQSTQTGAGNTHTSATRSPLKFEIHIIKVPLVGLFGVHFKKVSGNTWMYKTLAGEILNELNL